MIRAFNKPFSFEGRIGRVDFIYAFGSAIVTPIIIVVVTANVVEDEELTIFVSLILAISSLWYLLAQGAKRLHDINLSGWVQVVYPIAFFLMIFKPGDPNDNQFGETLIDKNETTSRRERRSKPNLSRAEHLKIDLPVYCPQCKSPNNTLDSICEWCGHQF